MYEYIKGSLGEITPTSAVVEAGGIGYYIHISLNSYTALTGKQQCQLYLHHVVREDAHLLFGFVTTNEREMFRQLISVTGVGANTARMMLSSSTPDEIRTAIMQQDVSKLKSIKGIGAKTAERIIVDLKDKVSNSLLTGELFVQGNNKTKEEALSALTMLGFSTKPAEKAISVILSEKPDIDLEDLIKKALKIL